jgi:hypothetical protein
MKELAADTIRAGAIEVRKTQFKEKTELLIDTLLDYLSAPNTIVFVKVCLLFVRVLLLKS